MGPFGSLPFDARPFDAAPTFTSSTPQPYGRSGLGGDDVPRRRNPNKGWDKAEWKRRVKDNQEALEQTLRDAYEAITAPDVPVSVLAQADAIVRPVAKKQIEDAPLQINWSALANDYRRSVALMKLWQEEQELRAQIEDEDMVIMAVFS